MQINQINAFIAITKSGSLARASELLHATPAALSQRIKRFESILGAEVFVRTPRGMELSEQGLEIYDKALNISEGVKELCETTSKSDIILPDIILGVSTALNAATIKNLVQASNHAVTIRKIGDDAMYESIKNDHIDLCISYDTNLHDGVLSQHAGNSRFVLLKTLEQDINQVGCSIVLPNISILLNKILQTFCLKRPCRVIYSDCSDISIQYVLNRNCVALIDSKQAERYVNNNPGLVIHEQDIILSYSVHYKNKSKKLRVLADTIIDRIDERANAA